MIIKKIFTGLKKLFLSIRIMVKFNNHVKNNQILFLHHMEVKKHY